MMALTMASVDHWVPKSLQILETWLTAFVGLGRFELQTFGPPDH